MLSGTTLHSPFGRVLSIDRTKSGRLAAPDAPKNPVQAKLGRRGSLDSNYEVASCSTRGVAEAATEETPFAREADANPLPYIPSFLSASDRFLTPASLVKRATSLYSLPDFGILQAVKTQQAPTQTPPVKDKRPPPDPKKREDFYANVGEAIRVLRAEIPTLFQKDLTYDIYREDVVFRDPRNCFHGLKDYKTIFWSLRFHGKLFFKMLYVDVLRIWESPKNPTDAGTILKMRWSVHGIPRVPWDAEGIFDGISTFKLDSSGKIFEHEVNNVILRDPPKQGNPFLAGLNLIPIPQQQQRIPCPGAWYQAAQKHPEEMNGAQ